MRHQVINDMQAQATTTALTVGGKKLFKNFVNHLIRIS